MPPKKGLVHIGTSGWHYQHWKGAFYPKDIADREMLKYYADKFHTVEINNSFYHLPDARTLKEWKDTVAHGFIFAAKASRYITHMKKLKEAREPVDSFLNRMEALGGKIGPILFQLPPRWKVNVARLEDFLSLLPVGLRCAFEFRDTSWFTEEVYGKLREHEKSFCIYDFGGTLSPRETTAGYVYIRLHGPDGAYRGTYDDSTLAGWAGAISAWSRQGKEVFCYFDNDEAGYAAKDAMRLKEMAG